MEESQWKYQLRQMMDAEWLQQFKEDYPAGAREVVGVPTAMLHELARTYGRADNWREVVAACKEGSSFEEVFLMVAVTVAARPEFSEVLETLQVAMPRIDSTQLCDMVCLSVTMAREYPEEMLGFLQPCWEGADDMAMRMAIVILLDHFINTDYIDRVLMRLAALQPCGPRSMDAYVWLASVCYLAYPVKTYMVLENLNVDEDVFSQIVERIERSPRLQPKDRMALASLRMNHIGKMQEE